ncbi:hypothetical protein [Corynebacterium hindlerae]|uniref:hypothetical protein n=1 Tax=Corynebacterium hindlerae TaxID=699041 RepID=UPI003AAE95DF
MNERSLGTAYDCLDQGRAMLFCAGGWVVYLILVSVADIINPGSIFSALTRFGSTTVFICAVLAFPSSMPAFLKVPTRITVGFALIGSAVQLSGVFNLMEHIPNIGQFTASFLFAQLLYAGGLFALSYCFLQHPLFPSWIAIALAIDASFWVAYYIITSQTGWNLFLEVLAWGPSMVVESCIAFYLAKVGLQLQKVPKTIL